VSQFSVGGLDSSDREGEGETEGSPDGVGSSKSSATPDAFSTSVISNTEEASVASSSDVCRLARMALDVQALMAGADGKRSPRESNDRTPYFFSSELSIPGPGLDNPRAHSFNLLSPNIETCFRQNRLF